MCIDTFAFAWIMEVNIETTSSKTVLNRMYAWRGGYDSMKRATTTTKITQRNVRFWIIHVSEQLIELCAYCIYTNTDQYISDFFFLFLLQIFEPMYIKKRPYLFQSYIFLLLLIFLVFWPLPSLSLSLFSFLYSHILSLLLSGIENKA